MQGLWVCEHVNTGVPAEVYLGRNIRVTGQWALFIILGSGPQITFVHVMVKLIFVYLWTKFSQQYIIRSWTFVVSDPVRFDTEENPHPTPDNLE